MKEKEFLEYLEEMDLENREIKIKIYYYLNHNGNVLLDEEEMRDEFYMRLRELGDHLE